MSIEVTCPECAASQSVGNEKAGLRMRCRQCGAIVAIPLSAGVVKSPDGFGAKLSPKSKSPRRSPLTPLIRPLVYAGVTLFAVSALLFRWWFNPPPPPKPLTPQEITARQQTTVVPITPGAHDLSATTQSQISQTPSSPEPSERVKTALNDAREEMARQGMTSRFYSLLQGVAIDLPEIRLSTAPGAVEWNKFMLYERGIYLNAFRFTSPLDVPGDLFWCFASTTSVGSWYILPAEGAMSGFRNYKPVGGGLEGLDLPANSQIIAQQLLGGQIAPGKTYVVYFNARTSQPQPFRVAARVLPSKHYKDQDGRMERMLRLLGAKRLLQPEPTPGGRMLTGHSDEIVGHVWLASGELLTIDADGNVCRWDVADATLKAKFSLGQHVQQAAITADGNRALLLCGDQSAPTLWDLKSNASLAVLAEVNGKPNHACFSFDETSCYVLSERTTPDNTPSFELLQWSPDRNEVLARRDEEKVWCYHLSASALGPRVLGHATDRSQAVSLQWAADLSADPRRGNFAGQYLLNSALVLGGTQEILVDFYGVVQLADPQSGKTSYAAALPALIYDVCSLPDDRYAALSCYDGAVHLYDTRERQIRMTWIGHEEAARNVSVSPDGKTLASFGVEGVIRLWDPAQPSFPDFNAETLTDSQGHELKPIPAAEYLRGTSRSYRDPTKFAAHPQFLQWEYPQHRVRISKPYYLASKEVTVGQFRKFVEAANYVTTVERNGTGGLIIEALQRGLIRKPELNWRSPGYPQTDQHPVVQVTTEDAVAYCDWLSGVERAKYRLPTEAEWEFACGADALTQRSFIVTDRNHALCCNLADVSIVAAMGEYATASDWNDGHPYAAEVGALLPNKFGLYDMHGNVWELCADRWTQNYGPAFAPQPLLVDPMTQSGNKWAVRGASFYCDMSDARACRRDSMEQDETQVDVGFRVLREFPDP